MRRIIAALLVMSLLPITTMAVPTEFDSRIPDGYTIGTSTQASGKRPIWVRERFVDAESDFWFYNEAQHFRKLGVLVGDQYGQVFLQHTASAAEVYTLFVRYIYSDAYAGEELCGATYGDYTYMGHTAWLDAYNTVHDKLAGTISLMEHDVALPAGEKDTITRAEAFVLYCMAALSRCDDPVWYFNQFSSARLGYYARSNAPIKRYGTEQDVLRCFSVEDQLGMSALQIQCANMLMYLGVLQGDQFHTLAPDTVLDRASAVKLLACIDNMDSSPHVNDQGDDSNDDWGGKPGEFDPPTTPEPTPTPTPEPTSTPTPEPTPSPTPEPENKIVSVIFVDLENKVVGSLPVRTNTDLREAIHNYVRENLVHPDLRDGDPTDISRENTYRHDDYDSGKYYTCTRYIDYAMIRTPIKKQGDRYVVQPSGGKEYQWAYGWAVGKPTEREKVWSVLGVAELEDWDGASFSAENVQILDPEKGVQETVILKPVFQPGPEMYYGTEDDPAYYRFVAASHWYYNSAKNEEKALKYGQIAEHSAPGRGDLSAQYGDWISRLPGRDETYTISNLGNALSSLEDSDTVLLDEADEAKENDLQGPEWNRFCYYMFAFQNLTFERTHTMPDGSLRGVPYARELTCDWIMYYDMTENYHDYKGLVGTSTQDNWPLFDNGRYYSHVEITIKQAGDKVTFNIDAVDNFHYGVVILRDKYKSNFVIGVEKSAPWRSLNNYNYDMPTRNTLYPATEDIKDVFGTYGFAVDALISFWLEEYEDEGRRAALFWNYPLENANVDTPLIDLNWNADSDKRKLCIELFGDLIKCIHTHGHENNIDFWDEWLDQPRINFHQLQLYVYDWENMKYNGGPQAHVKSQAEADATIIPNCKLHYTCQNGG